MEVLLGKGAEMFGDSDVYVGDEAPRQRSRFRKIAEAALRRHGCRFSRLSFRYGGTTRVDGNVDAQEVHYRTDLTSRGSRYHVTVSIGKRDGRHSSSYIQIEEKWEKHSRLVTSRGIKEVL